MSLPSILQTIVAHKRTEIAARREQPLNLAAATVPRDFAAALRGDRVRLIAEVKKASPSRGVLRSHFDPTELATTYATNGAAAISVLTDERFFQGRDDDLTQIREAVPLPVLRKEFIVDPWQVAESRALGADAILLIVALLDAAKLQDLASRARDLGMATLVEVHTSDELYVALSTDAPIIGINNRDLNTFDTTLETTERLGPRVKEAGRLLVSESGIFTASDVAHVAAAGADAILVGEALVTSPDTASLVRELASVPRPT